MATTTNYGWTTPDNTAYVKDGASAIRTLGSSVDTSLYSALNGRPAGLVLLNTTAVSGAANTTISNVFSSTYDNYRITIDGVLASGSDSTRMQLTTGGTPATTNYSNATFYVNNGGASGINISNSGQTYWSLLTHDTTAGNNSMIFDIFNPSLAKRTVMNMMGGYIGGYASFGSFFHATATAYDGLKFMTATSTFTGTIRIYGYKNS